MTPEMEGHILGQILIDNEGLEHYSHIQKRFKMRFKIERNRVIFKVMIALYDEGKSVDLITVSNRCEQVGLIHAENYLAELVDTYRPENRYKHHEHVDQLPFVCIGGDLTNATYVRLGSKEYLKCPDGGWDVTDCIEVVETPQAFHDSGREILAHREKALASSKG